MLVLAVQGVCAVHLPTVSHLWSPSSCRVSGSHGTGSCSALTNGQVVDHMVQWLYRKEAHMASLMGCFSMRQSLPKASTILTKGQYATFHELD